MRSSGLAANRRFYPLNSRPWPESFGGDFRGGRAGVGENGEEKVDRKRVQTGSVSRVFHGDGVPATGMQAALEALLLRRLTAIVRWEQQFRGSVDLICGGALSADTANGLRRVRAVVSTMYTCTCCTCGGVAK